MRFDNNPDLFRLLFSEASDSFLIIDQKGKIIDANKKMQEEINLPKDELIGKSFFDFILNYNFGKDLAEFLNNAEGTIYLTSVEFRRRDDLTLSIDFACDKVKYNKEKVFLMKVNNKTEVAFKEDREKQFISNISHELRTPLTNIRGYVELILQDYKSPITPELRENFKVINKNINRMRELIENLLDAAKKDHLSSQPVIEKFDPKKTIEETVSLNASLATEKGLDIQLNLEEGILVEGSKLDFIHAVTNIFINAIKYTYKGYVRFTMTREINNLCLISIEDSGVGIESKYFSSIFEKFYRVPSDANKKIGGSGLGLYITRNAIEKMGGIILVESMIGKGSAFRIYLPTVKK